MASGISISSKQNHGLIRILTIPNVYCKHLAPTTWGTKKWTLIRCQRGNNLSRSHAWNNVHSFSATPKKDCLRNWKSLTNDTPERTAHQGKMTRSSILLLPFTGDSSSTCEALRAQLECPRLSTQASAMTSKRWDPTNLGPLPHCRWTSGKKN